MATYWVDSEGDGNDANDGTAATNGVFPIGPKRTWPAAVALLSGSKGNTLNVIARATPYIVTATTSVTATGGTDYDTDFGFKIQGTTVSGTPAIARLTWPDDAASQTAISVAGATAYNIIQGIFCDMSALTSAIGSATKALASHSTSASFTRIRYCHAIGPTAATSGNLFIANMAVSNTAFSYEVYYCVFTDLKQIVALNTTGNVNSASSFHNNICEEIALTKSTATRRIHTGTSAWGANSNHEIYNNTVVVKNPTRAIFIQATGNTAHANSIMRCHSNVFANIGAAAVNSSWMIGASAWEGLPWTGTRDIGWNVFTATAGFNWTTAHPYAVPWDEDDTDLDADDTGEVWSTDQLNAAVDPFNASSTPWTWTNVNSSGYDLPVSGDYRLAVYRTAGKGGIVPGAIAERANVAPVAVNDNYTVNNAAPFTESAPGVLANDIDADLDPLTAILVSGLSPSTAGTLLLNADGSFTYTPAAGFIGVATFTYKANDGFDDSNTATVTITVINPPSVLLGGGSLFGPAVPGRIEASAGIRVQRNVDIYSNQLHEPGRANAEAMWAANAIVLPNTIDAVLPLAGVTVTHLFIQTDKDIIIKINGQPFTILAGGAMYFSRSTGITAVLITNSSAVATATLTYVVG